MDSPEYLSFRCCMCPNSYTPTKTICPTGPRKKNETPCRFVKTYIDNRGWLYRVMPGLGDNIFKARYLKPDKTGWRCCRNFEWRMSFDIAQSDLNAIAKFKKWQEHD